MDWRVLIYSSDYKHADLSLTHPQTHSIMRGVDTPRLHTVIVHFFVYTMDSLGRARHGTNYTNNVSIRLPYKVDELQYSGTTHPLSCKQKCDKVDYSSLRTFSSTTTHTDSLYVTAQEKYGSTFGIPFLNKK